MWPKIKGKDKMETLKVFGFSEIFVFAEKYYGIAWNPCNNVFFGNALEYGTHTRVEPGDWQSMVSFPDAGLKEKASEYTKEDVDQMSDLDKSFVILSAYFESLDIDDDEVLVNCQ
jgi:hypothetical protein